MLARIVSISWPHDPPASASQSAGSTRFEPPHPAKNLFLNWQMIIHVHGGRSFFFFFFFRQGLALTLRLECCGVITTHCSLYLLVSSHLSTSASWVAGTIGMCHHAQLIFNFLYRDGLLMLPRLVLNSWPQGILLCQLPKVLGLQVWATVPSS